MPIASAPPPSRGARKPFPDRLLRGVALVFLSLFHLQLKVLAGLVRFAISSLRKGPKAGKREIAEYRP